MILMSLCSSCGGRQQSAASGQQTDSVTVPETLVVERQQTDSAVFVYKAERLECRIVASIPPDAVRPAMGRWISSRLGGSYTGNSADIKALVAHYGKCHADTLQQFIDDGVPDWAELLFDARVEPLFENDHSVTYLLTIEQDFGGAHPTYTSIGSTFSKSDGLQLGWDLVRTEFADSLRRMVVDELVGYFGVSTKDELADMVQGFEVANIPLPINPPYLTADGLAFAYQQYEIAPYAAGLPSGTLSIDALKPWLTDKARRLLCVSE